MKTYNKLVRDRIIEIIENDGRKANYRVLNQEEYKIELNRKLQEEVKEYIDENCIEELADIVEVIYGLLGAMNVSIEDFEKVRLEKREKRGGFDKRLFLIESE